ncbi:MAG: ABC transporter transmembrane domain-containing protein [Phycisphaerae bacterium]|nr:ABC transporter transmembrane domain-containing protein [Phycisphaerae bacterium]
MKNFRQSLTYIKPYRWRVAVGIIAAIGVSIFFTTSIGMLIPVLQVITSREGVSGWIYRTDIEHRLGVKLPQPDDPTRVGAEAIQPVFVKVTDDKAADRAGFRQYDIIVSVDGEPIDNSLELAQRLCNAPVGRELAVIVDRRAPAPTSAAESAGGSRRIKPTITLAVPERAWYRGVVVRVARWLPEDTDRHNINIHNRMWALFFILLAIFGMTILRNACRYVNELSIQGASLQAIMDMRSRAYHQLTSLPLSHFGKNGVTDAISRVIQDTGQINVGFTTLFGKTIQEPLIAAGAMGFAFWLEWRVALAAVVAAPISYLVIRKFGKKMRKAAKKALVSSARQLAVLEETLYGLRVVKAYTMEGYERKRYFRVQRQLLKEQMRMRRFDSAVSPMLEVLGSIGLIAAAMLAANLVLKSSLDFRVLITQLFLLGLGADAGRKLSNVNNRLQQADAAAERVFGMINAEPEQVNHLGPKVGPLRGEIVFENIGFRYPGTEAMVLRDVTIRARAGQTIAIVGPNGSGKTTILSLLPRFYEPAAGRVLWDGQDVAQVNLRSLRQQIGLVTQDAVIFADTAEANIRYGNKHISREQVVAAAKQAFADEFISQLPEGYDTVIGERGTTMSGGQRQRIALARAILRDPSVLILDEAMSQVDAESEGKIQRVLDEFLVGRTAFIIAHRFSTVRDAAQIVVLDAGQVVGAGRHGELMENCPLYRTLYTTQFRETESGGPAASPA